MHIVSGDLWAGAEVQAYTLISQLRSRCELSVVLLNSGRLADELERAQVPVTILNEAELGSLKILISLRQLMKKFNPDIVHTHRQKENILGSFANLLSVRAKSVRTSHGAPEFAPKGRQRLQVALNNFVGRYMQHAIIAVSTELKLKLEHIFPKGKIHTIHNGIDVESLRAAARTADFREARPDSIHIGIIGRLEPVKRIDIFLDMIPLVLQRLPERKFQFHVIGEGKLRSRLERQAEKIGIDQIVKFHGHRHDISACIYSLDAILMCSDHEGTPMTALEAMALGTPLVAHATGGLVEILSEHPELLVTDHSPEGYAKIITEVLSLRASKKFQLKNQYTADCNMEKTKILYETLTAISKK